MTEFATLGEALDANKIKQAGKASRKHFAIREQHRTVKPLKPEEMDAKYHKRCYHSGKTASDHSRGSHKTAQDNKEARATYTRWCSDHASAAASTDAAKAKFPSHACNGKKARALRAPRNRPKIKK